MRPAAAAVLLVARSPFEARPFRGVQGRLCGLPAGLAVGETAIVLRFPSLPSVGVSIAMERGVQQK